MKETFYNLLQTPKKKPKTYKNAPCRFKCALLDTFFVMSYAFFLVCMYVYNNSEVTLSDILFYLNVIHFNCYNKKKKINKTQKSSC